MKKQFKKIVAALLCFAMLLSSVPSYAASEEAKYDIWDSLVYINDYYGVVLSADNLYKNSTTDFFTTNAFYNSDISSFIKVGDNEYEFGNECNSDWYDSLTNEYTTITEGPVEVNEDQYQGVNEGFKYSNDTDKFDYNVMTEWLYDNPGDEYATKGKITYTIKNNDVNEKAFNFAIVSNPVLDDNSFSNIFSVYAEKVGEDSIYLYQGDKDSDCNKTQLTLKMDPMPDTRYVGAYYDENNVEVFDTTRYTESLEYYYTGMGIEDNYTLVESSWSFNLLPTEEKTITIFYDFKNDSNVKLTFKKLDGTKEYIDTFKGEMIYLPELPVKDFEVGKNLRWKNTRTGELLTSSELYLVQTGDIFEEYKYVDSNGKHKMSVKYCGEGIDTLCDYDNNTYINNLSFEYEAEETINFESYIGPFLPVGKFKVYPTGEYIEAGTDGFTISEMPNSDIFLEPVISFEPMNTFLGDLCINFEKKNDMNFPDVVCNQCQFEVEWLNTNGETTTTFEYNTPYAAHITINGDPDNGGIAPNNINSIIFNETVYNGIPLGISTIVLGPSPYDKDVVLTDYYGWYYDSDTKKIHVYMHYACLDSLKLYLDNIFVDGNVDETDMYFDKPEFASIAQAVPTNYDLPDTLYEGQKMTMMALYSYDSMGMGNDKGVVDVNKFEVLEGENSRFKVSPYKNNNADEFIMDLIIKYGDPMDVLINDPGSISGNWINKNSYALIAIFDIEVTNNKSTPSSGGSSSKKYKTTNTSDSAEKISGSGKKGSTRTITPIEGKKVSSVIVTDKDGNKVDVTLNEDGTYSFKQPASDVNIEVNYKNREITLNIGSTEASVDGEKSNLDVCPVIRNDRTMLPIRYVAENLGAKVEWNELETNMVYITRGDTKIEIKIGSDIMKVNGKEVKLDSVAFAENDRTFLPVRAISEALNAIVEWNESEPNVVKIFER